MADVEGPSRAVYAVATAHYDAPAFALQAFASNVVLARRFEPSPRLVRSLERIAPSAARIAGRRERRSPEGSVRVESLGVGQFIAPIELRLGVHYGSRSKRVANHLMARKVERITTDGDILQFGEGMGIRAMRTRRLRLAVMERRSFHHLDYERAVDALLGFPHHPAQDPLREVLSREYERADVILAYSRAQAESLRRNGVDPDKVQIAPIPVPGEATPYEPSQSRRDFAFVGRLDVHKGIDVACAAVRELGSGARLKVAGPAAREVVEWIRRQDHVDYLGVLGRKDLNSLYKSVTALVSPSVESFGLAPLEAASVGTPVVCRETTGIAEFLPPELCRVVEGRDPLEWSKVLAEVASATDGVDEIVCARIPQLYAELSKENTVSKLERIYREALAKTS